MANKSSIHKLARPAAVAGSFYPSNRHQLREMVENFLRVNRKESSAEVKGVIAPHAGYMFSGAVAGSAFSTWAGEGNRIGRVVLMGPSHFHPFEGVALSRYEFFSTPLGEVPVDIAAIESLRTLPYVNIDEKAHTREHSLEVELPFLQALLQDFQIVPLVVGHVQAETLRNLMHHLWGGNETKFVISSDLSHFLDYQTARELDERTSASIVTGQCHEVGPEQACGWLPIQGFGPAACDRDLRVENVDLRNSADAGGPPERVVGYGAFWFHQAES